jgi:hypothetical protein
MRKAIIAAIGLLFILFYCSSCGVFIDTGKWHLRRAEKHIKKAEMHGATWRRDTTWKMMSFKTQAIEFSTVLKPVFTRGRAVINTEKDGAVTAVEITLADGCPDSCIREVKIQTKCPEQTAAVKVPVAINNEITPGKPVWKYWPWLLVVLAIGYVLGYLTCGNPRDDPVIRYIFSKDKKEEPPV